MNDETRLPQKPFRGPLDDPKHPQQISNSNGGGLLKPFRTLEGALLPTGTGGATKLSAKPWMNMGGAHYNTQIALQTRPKDPLQRRLGSPLVLRMGLGLLCPSLEAQHIVLANLRGPL